MKKITLNLQISKLSLTFFVISTCVKGFLILGTIKLIKIHMRQSRIIIDFRGEKDKKVKSFTGITLGRNDIIKVGVYGTHRMKVSTVLERYGKKGIKELLNHYDLEEDILIEYHFLHKTNDNEQDKHDFVQEIMSVSIPMEETFVTTTTQKREDEKSGLDLQPPRLTSGGKTLVTHRDYGNG